MNLGENNKLLAAISVNGVSGSLTPLVHSMQPILSAILTLAQVGVAVVTLLILIRQLKGQKNKRK